MEYNVLYSKPYDLQETKITVMSSGRKKNFFSRSLKIFEFLMLFFMHVYSPLPNSKNIYLLYSEITTKFEPQIDIEKKNFFLELAKQNSY